MYKLSWAILVSIQLHIFNMHIKKKKIENLKKKLHIGLFELVIC